MTFMLSYAEGVRKLNDVKRIDMKETVLRFNFPRQKRFALTEIDTNQEWLSGKARL